MSIEAKIKLSGGNAVSIDGDTVLIEGGLFVADDVPKLIVALNTLMRWRDEAEGKAVETLDIVLTGPSKNAPHTLTREELEAMRAASPPADMDVSGLTDVQISKLQSVVETTMKDGERNVYLTPGDPQRWLDAVEVMLGGARRITYKDGAIKLGDYGELFIEDAADPLAHIKTPFKRQYDPEVMERG